MFKKQINRIIFVSILVVLCAVNVLSNKYAVDSNGKTVLVDEIAIESTRAGLNDDSEEVNDYEYYYDEYEKGYEGDKEEDYYKGDEKDADNDVNGYGILHISSEEYEKIERDDEFNWRIHGSINDLWYNLGCDRIFEKTRPIHPQSSWKHARALYKSLASEDNCTLPDHEDNGFSVKFEARHSPGKGRGVFATQDIKKGQLIYQLNQTAMFDNGPAYRKFILGLEAGFACDVLQWAYVQDIDGYDADATSMNLRISVDLDEGCFCNDGGWFYIDGYWENEANVGCPPDIAKEFLRGCSSNFFALSDIKAGEELLCSYSDFVITEGWSEFGLQ